MPELLLAVDLAPHRPAVDAVLNVMSLQVHFRYVFAAHFAAAVSLRAVLHVGQPVKVDRVGRVDFCYLLCFHAVPLPWLVNFYFREIADPYNAVFTIAGIALAPNALNDASGGPTGGQPLARQRNDRSPGGCDRRVLAVLAATNQVTRTIAAHPFLFEGLRIFKDDDFLQVGLTAKFAGVRVVVDSQDFPASRHVVPLVCVASHIIKIPHIMGSDKFLATLFFIFLLFYLRCSGISPVRINLTHSSAVILAVKSVGLTEIVSSAAPIERSMRWISFSCATTW